MPGALCSNLNQQLEADLRFIPIASIAGLVVGRESLVVVKRLIVVVERETMNA